MLPFHSPLETTATESEFVGSAMIVGVAVLVERFYKPELDAAHNPPLQAIGQAFFLSVKPLRWCYDTLAGYN
jgi:hypothetical protein